MKHQPSEYIWILAWARYAGTNMILARTLQEKASRSNAPINSIYRSGRSKEWRQWTSLDAGLITKLRARLEE